jgi:hypothetical protein
MKTLLVLSLLLGGSGTALVAETDVDQTIKQNIFEIRQKLRNRRINFNIDTLREDGFPMPSDAYLMSLTDEQRVVLVSYIDSINETYDFSEMTDEDIKSALVDILPDFRNLLMEYNISGFKEALFKDYVVLDIRENGFTLPEWSFLEDLTTEQALDLNAYIAELNASYDIENMSDDEILDVLESARQELKDQLDDFGVLPHPIRDRILEKIIVDGAFTIPERLLERLDEGDLEEVTAFVNEVNANNDFDEMTEQEQMEFLKSITEEFKTLLEELDINLPQNTTHRIRNRIRLYKYKNK